MIGCVFCDIVAGRTSAALVVYRSGGAVGFIAEKPDAYGHAVLASTVHYRDLLDAPAAVVSDLMLTVQQVAHAYRHVVGAEGFHLLHASGRMAQQSVAHLHVHLIPRFSNDGLNAWPDLGGTSESATEMASRLRLPTAV